ncbi:MAG: hypothetical protein Roseis2KO_53020 [Roseivirga sp.]
MRTPLLIYFMLCSIQHYAQTADGKHSEFKKLKCGLYQNKAGDIGFKTKALADDQGNFRIIYQQHVYLIDKHEPEQQQPVAFREVVDTASFEILNPFYCKDKTYVYAIHYTSGGAVFNATKRIDPGSFNVFGTSTYGTDGKKVYYRINTMKMADRASFNSITGSENGAYDKKNYYLDGEVMSLEDVRAMGFDKKKNQ